MFIQNSVRTLWVAAVTGLLICTIGCGSQPTAGRGGQFRLGVFNSRVVALAYGRSEQHDAEVESKMAAYRRAKEAGDRERMAELEIWGREGQDRMHRQVFGDAPIPDILEKMADELPEVVRCAPVDAIVTGVHHAGPGVRVVDVTEQMAAVWNPDERTQGLMRELPKHPPASADEVRGHCDE